MYNETSLTKLCSSLCDIMGIKPPINSTQKSEEFTQKIERLFEGKKADRIVMFNPDAIAQWVYQKYPKLLEEVTQICDVHLSLRSVMPSVTPVCFGSMYTGAEPSIHGIQSYIKPVIRIDTIFDSLIRAGKKPAIIVTEGDSLSKIYLERNMDYFIYPTVEEVNAKAVELILEDKYDFIVIYNGNYDATMHKFGPESIEALSELKANARTFGIISTLIKNHWKNHNTLLGFAMDHGCHEIDGGCGSHGLDMEEDLNICHLYKVFKGG